MAVLVEGHHDTTFSSAYRTALDARSTRIEIETAKELSKSRIGSSSTKPCGAKGAAGEE